MTKATWRRIPRRKFTLLDGMMLIAGVAVGFAGFRVDFGENRFLAERWPAEIYSISGKWLMLASILVLAWRLRRPRPPIRRIARQPGTAACCAMLVFGVGYSAQDILREAVNRVMFDEQWLIGGWYWHLLQSFEYQCAFLVVVVWIILALGRIGRPEAGWIDRSGRLVGWLWIVWGIGGSFL